MSPVPIIYTKPNCAGCHMWKHQLTKANVPYVEEPLTEETAYEYSQQGYQAAPIVTYGEQTFSGFRPEAVYSVINQYHGEVRS